MNPNLVLLQSALMFAMAGGVLALSTYVMLWAGLLSFATVSFAAIGAFLSVYLLDHTNMGLPLALVVSAAVSGAVGLIVGRLFLRLASHWLALATVALVLITRVFVVNLDSWTGGSAGEVVPVSMSWWQLLIVLVIVCALLWALKRSKYGVAADTSREDVNVAGALGVPTARIRILAFGLSGAIGGVGGVMQASKLSYISPDTFYIDLSVTVIASVVLGGAYHWFGSVIGAIVFTGLPVYISQYINQGQSIINGALLLLIIIWLPGGLIDPVAWRRLRERRRERFGEPDTVADVGSAADERVGVLR